MEAPQTSSHHVKAPLGLRRGIRSSNNYFILPAGLSFMIYKCVVCLFILVYVISCCVLCAFRHCMDVTLLLLSINWNTNSGICSRKKGIMYSSLAFTYTWSKKSQELKWQHHLWHKFIDCWQLIGTYIEGTNTPSDLAKEKKCQSIIWSRYSIIWMHVHVRLLLRTCSFLAHFHLEGNDRVINRASRLRVF